MQFNICLYKQTVDLWAFPHSGSTNRNTATPQITPIISILQLFNKYNVASISKNWQNINFYSEHVKNTSNVHWEVTNDVGWLFSCTE